MKELIHLIVKEIYGDEFANICLIIYSRGTIDLKSLIIESKKSFSEIKEILIILIKNNFVAFAIPNPDNLPDQDLIANAEYRLLVDNILHNIRFPIFLDLITKIYSKNERDCLIATNIIELFFLESSLNVSEVLRNFNENLESGELKGNYSFDEHEILRVLISLIKGNYITRISQTLFLKLNEEIEEKDQKDQKATLKRKRKAKENVQNAKGKKKIKMQEDALHFLHEMPHELKVLTEGEEFLKMDLKILNKNQDNFEIKEKIEKSNPLLFDNTTQKEILLQINFRQFIHQLRTNVIVEMAEEKISIQGAFIIQAMLNHSKLISPAFDIKHTETLSVDQILSILPAHIKIEPGALIAQLEVLKNDNGNFIIEKIVTENFISTKKYAVNLENLIRNLQIKVFEKILSKIYSPYHVRIFRILMKFQHLDDKKIQELGMIPMAETRKYIHELFKDNILSNQDITDEKDAKITVYYIKHKMVLEKLRENLIKTIYNLKIQKSKYEEKLNDPMKEHNNEKEIILEKIYKCESAILDVDSSLLIFTEF